MPSGSKPNGFGSQKAPGPPSLFCLEELPRFPFCPDELSLCPSPTPQTSYPTATHPKPNPRAPPDSQSCKPFVFWCVCAIPIISLPAPHVVVRLPETSHCVAIQPHLLCPMCCTPTHPIAMLTRLPKQGQAQPFLLSQRQPA